MKSKFFGLSAKLALAIAVTGTMLTSCYKEDGDVALPANMPDPVYTVTGQVTDGSTGKAIAGATVAITASGVTFTTASTATTDSQGNYTVVGTAAPKASITASAAFSYTGYEGKSVTATTTLSLNAGEAATFNLSAVLFPTSYVSPLRLVSTSSERFIESKTLTKDDDAAIEVINESANSVGVTLDILTEWGAKYVENTLTGDFKTAVANYLGNVSTSFGTLVHPYYVVVPSAYTLSTVTLYVTYELTEYTFEFEGVTDTVKVANIYSASFSNTQINNGHSHGHAHGHGGEVNAGGGIVDSIL